MTPGTYNFSVVRGTSGPTQGLVFRLKDSNGDPVPFDDVRLSISRGATLLLRATLGNGIANTDPGEGEFTWAPSTADTRKIPKGEKSHYEIEVWIGSSEIVYLQGTITGIGGINDDEDVS